MGKTQNRSPEKEFLPKIWCSGSLHVQSKAGHSETLAASGLKLLMDGEGICLARAQNQLSSPRGKVDGPKYGVGAFQSPFVTCSSVWHASLGGNPTCLAGIPPHLRSPSGSPKRAALVPQPTALIFLFAVMLQPHARLHTHTHTRKLRFTKGVERPTLPNQGGPLKSQDPSCPIAEKQPHPKRQTLGIRNPDLCGSKLPVIDHPPYLQKKRLFDHGDRGPPIHSLPH